MQVSVEAPSNIQRRITVVVPVEKFDEEYDKRISKLSKTANIKGFRPGKAPINVIKQRYGDAVRNEALSEVIQNSLQSAIHQEKLIPVGIPQVEPKTVIPGQPLEFVATFEIAPTIDDVHFDVTSLEKKVATINEEDIDKVVKYLREQQTKWIDVERPAQEKDQVIIDFKGTIDNVPFQGGDAHDYNIILGSKVMLPGFEEGILGAVKGEERTIHVPFPADYFAKEVAGKTGQFAIKVLRVQEPHLPELDENFVKKLGVKYNTITDLRDEIRRNLERELARVISVKLKEQIFNKLLEQNPLEVPNSLITREAQRIHDELHPHHKGQEHHHSDAENAMFENAAKRNVLLGFLIGALVRKHDIVADKDRVKSLIESLSSSYENPAEVSKWYNSNKKARAEVEMQVLEDQIVEKLMENIQIVEKVMSYNELISEKPAVS